MVITLRLVGMPPSYPNRRNAFADRVGTTRYWWPSRIRLGLPVAAHHPGRMTQIPIVTDDAFAAEVLESERPVLVDFTAAWCPPCRVMKPVLTELAAERDDLRVVQLDVDEHQRTAAEYGVLSMPTFILFRDGREVQRLVGARPRRRLEAELAEVL